MYVTQNGMIVEAKINTLYTCYIRNLNSICGCLHFVLHTFLPTMPHFDSTYYLMREKKMHTMQRVMGPKETEIQCGRVFVCMIFMFSSLFQRIV